MNGYNAPLQDMRFVLNELAGMAEVSGLPVMPKRRRMSLRRFSTSRRSSPAMCWRH